MGPYRGIVLCNWEPQSRCRGCRMITNSFLQGIPGGCSMHSLLQYVVWKRGCHQGSCPGTLGSFWKKFVQSQCRQLLVGKRDLSISIAHTPVFSQSPSFPISSSSGFVGRLSNPILKNDGASASLSDNVLFLPFLEAEDSYCGRRFFTWHNGQLLIQFGG